jgi:peptide/nickel transport system substrate-binding protein
MGHSPETHEEWLTKRTSEGDQEGAGGEQRKLTRSNFLLKGGGAAGGMALLFAPSLAQAANFRRFVESAAIATLRWNLGVEPVSLDVARSFGGETTKTLGLTSDTLMTFSPSLSVVPGIASAAHQLSRTHYEFTIPKDVRFSDGSLMTVDDVLFSLNRHINPAAPSQIGSFFASVSSFTKAGTHTITARLKQPDPTFLFALILAPIVPHAFATSQGQSFGSPGQPWVGTGPFQLVSYDSTGISLVPNPHYARQRPAVKNVNLSYIADTSTLQLAMRSGQIDGTFNVQPADLATWSQTPGTKVELAAGMAFQALAFNLEAPPWDDIHVRRAFAHALNQQGIVRSVLHGAGDPANAIVPPQMWSGLVPRTTVQKIYGQIPRYKYNLALAKAELAKSSVPNGFSASILIPSIRTSVLNGVLAFANDLASIGIKLNVQSVPFAQYRAARNSHQNLGITFIGFVPDYPDPIDYLNLLYPSANAVPNGFNIANYRNATVDDLLDKQAKATSASARAQYIGEILKISGTDLPYLTMWWEDTAIAIRNGLKLHGFNAFTYETQWTKNLTAA